MRKESAVLVEKTMNAQSDIWGTKASDWATYQEPAHIAIYSAVLSETGAGVGKKILDVGCGTGLFLEMASKTGAEITGVDFSPGFLEFSKQRLPEGDFHLAEMEKLPFADNTFDAVVGVNSFQFSKDPVKAFKEAKRVSKDKVIISFFTSPKENDLFDFISSVRPFMPPEFSNGPTPFTLSKEGKFEEVAKNAGLKIIDKLNVESLWTYPNMEIALKALGSSGPAAMAMKGADAKKVKASIESALKKHETKTGSIQLRNRLNYFVMQK